MCSFFNAGIYAHIDKIGILDLMSLFFSAQSGFGSEDSPIGTCNFKAEASKKRFSDNALASLLSGRILAQFHHSFNKALAMGCATSWMMSGWEHKHALALRNSSAVMLCKSPLLTMKGFKDNML